MGLWSSKFSMTSSNSHRRKRPSRGAEHVAGDLEKSGEKEGSEAAEA